MLFVMMFNNLCYGQLSDYDKILESQGYNNLHEYVLHTPGDRNGDWALSGKKKYQSSGLGKIVVRGQITIAKNADIILQDLIIIEGERPAIIVEEGGRIYLFNCEVYSKKDCVLNYSDFGIMAYESSFYSEEGQHLNCPDLTLFVPLYSQVYVERISIVTKCYFFEGMKSESINIFNRQECEEEPEEFEIPEFEMPSEVYFAEDLEFEEGQVMEGGIIYGEIVLKDFLSYLVFEGVTFINETGNCISATNTKIQLMDCNFYSKNDCLKMKGGKNSYWIERCNFYSKEGSHLDTDVIDVWWRRGDWSSIGYITNTYFEGGRKINGGFWLTLVKREPVKNMAGEFESPNGFVSRWHGLREPEPGYMWARYDIVYLSGDWIIVQTLESEFYEGRWDPKYRFGPLYSLTAQEIESWLQKNPEYAFSE